MGFFFLLLIWFFFFSGFQKKRIRCIKKSNAVQQIYRILVCTRKPNIDLFIFKLATVCYHILPDHVFQTNLFIYINFNL